MPRNLDRRIEILVPIENARARQELAAVLDSAFSDTTNAWRLAADGTWSREVGVGDEGPHAPERDDATSAAARATRRRPRR